MTALDTWMACGHLAHEVPAEHDRLACLEAQVEASAEAALEAAFEEAENSRVHWFDEHAEEEHSHHHVRGSTDADGRVWVTHWTDDEEDRGYPSGDSTWNGIEPSPAAFFSSHGPTHWGVGGCYVQVWLDGYPVVAPTLAEHLERVAAAQRHARAVEHADVLYDVLEAFTRALENIGVGEPGSLVEQARALVNRVDGKPYEERVLAALLDPRALPAPGEAHA